MKKNKEIYQLKLNDASSYNISLIDKEYKSENRMIIQEAVFFCITLLIGIWYVNKIRSNQLDFERQKNNFLLSITHELKTPLSSIRLTLDTIGNSLTKKYKLIHQNALLDSFRLENMINKLLSSATLESNHDYNFETISVKDLIQNIFLKYSLFLENRQLDYISDKDYQLKIDKEAFSKAISNLIENAIKFTKPNGEITVSLKKLASGFELTISDNGIGIDKKYHKQVFEKFYRIGNEETKITQGSGLGLYIVKKIIEKHGGEIKIADHKPTGVNMIIKIPNKKSKSNLK